MSITGLGTLLAVSVVDQVFFTEGDLTLDGLTIEGGTNTTRAFFWMKNKMPQLSNLVINDIINGAFITVNGTTTVGVTVLNQTGNFLAINVRVDGEVNKVFDINGSSDWAVRSAHTCTALITNCHLKSPNFCYTFKGFSKVQVTDSILRDFFHETFVIEGYSQDVGLTGWSTSGGGVTIADNSLVTTAGSTGMTIPGFVIGQKYRVMLDVVTEAGKDFSIFSGGSGDLLVASGLTTGYHIFEFTADNTFLFIRATTAQTILFQKIRALRESTTKMVLVIDTLDNEVSNCTFYGGERGPTSGIDTFGSLIHGNTIYDAWIRAIALDTERLSPPAWDNLYPVSRALVHDNRAYDCGRFIFATCRELSIKDNLMKPASWQEYVREFVWGKS